MLHQLEEIVGAEKRAVEKIEEEKRRLLREGEDLRGAFDRKYRKETGSIEAEIKNYLNSELERLKSESGEKMKQVEQDVRSVLSDDTCRGRMISRMTEMLINSS